MITCTLEQVGDRFALVLDETQCLTLNLSPGDTVRLEVAGDGALRIAESWSEDPHARGRAFLKRMHRRASARLV
jgi:antitoxin component of MazEF toxin-antitoxin module